MTQKYTLQDVADFFQTNFRTDRDLRTGEPRWVGLENEYLLVSADGTMMKPEVLEYLWRDLTTHGWEPIIEELSHKTTGVRKNRDDLEAKKTHPYDIITTDLGYAILEIDLAPAQSLHQAHDRLSQLIGLLTAILGKYDTRLLGYGVQPVTGPGPASLGPKYRYPVMMDICNQENVHAESAYRVDLHTLDAACQTQVEISAAESIPVVNALNATAGLRIALLANSAVWQKQPAGYKAVRQMFVDWCWPSRKVQLGIPPKFQSIEHYVDYLLDFRALLVKREQTLYRLDNNKAFRQFFNDADGQYGVSLDGHRKKIVAGVEDILAHSGIAWFCARIQPGYGTIEDRISCQQPPDAHLCASALTLGLVENYRPLVEMAQAYSLDQWRELRLLATRHALACSYPGMPLNELLKQMLAIAHKGLCQRGLGEEVYLEPLYQRLAEKRCPADDVLQQFQDGGVESIVASYDMRNLASATLQDTLQMEYT